jgi:hypothetical protein
LIEGLAGNTDTASFCNTFKAHSNIHAIAVDIVVVNNDVTDIDADSECNAATLRDVGVAFRHSALNIDSAAHSLDRAGEFD